MGDAFLTTDQNSFVSFRYTYMLMLSTVKIRACWTSIA